MDIQTPAEKFLIKEVAVFVNRDSLPKLLLNVGAGKSLVIEVGIYERSSKPFVCDRLDVTREDVLSPLVRNIIVASVEDMSPANSGEYDAAFANYVLEHVADVGAAAIEIARVLKPGGYFILSSPNPQAPEFILSRHTSTRFHQFIKGKGQGHEAHTVQYAYKNINELINIFKQKGFELIQVKFFAFTFGYLYRFPALNWLSRAYDAMVNFFGFKRLMGNVGIVFKKIN